MKREIGLMKEISFRSEIGHIGNHEYPAECSVKDQVKFKKSSPV